MRSVVVTGCVDRPHIVVSPSPAWTRPARRERDEMRMMSDAGSVVRRASPLRFRSRAGSGAGSGAPASPTSAPAIRRPESWWQPAGGVCRLTWATWAAESVVVASACGRRHHENRRASGRISRVWRGPPTARTNPSAARRRHSRKIPARSIRADQPVVFVSRRFLPPRPRSSSHPWSPNHSGFDCLQSSIGMASPLASGQFGR